MATQPHADSEPVPTVETLTVQLDEVRTNHLSPMGAVDEMGRFARGAGPERLTRWFTWTIGAIAAMVVITLAVDLLG